MKDSVTPVQNLRVCRVRLEGVRLRWRAESDFGGNLSRSPGFGMQRRHRHWRRGWIHRHGPGLEQRACGVESLICGEFVERLKSKQQFMYSVELDGFVEC